MILIDYLFWGAYALCGFQASRRMWFWMVSYYEKELSQQSSYERERRRWSGPVAYWQAATLWFPLFAALGWPLFLLAITAKFVAKGFWRGFRPALIWLYTDPQKRKALKA